jgi:hypothetical protein
MRLGLGEVDVDDLRGGGFVRGAGVHDPMPENSQAN